MEAIKIDNTIVVEFGLGNLCIYKTELEAINNVDKTKYGLAIERYTKTHPIDTEIKPTDFLGDKIGQDIILVFHNTKAINSMIDDLQAVRERIEEQQEK